MVDHVWGIDVGVEKVAFATHAGETRSVSFGVEKGARRLDVAHTCLRKYVPLLARRWPPVWIFVENPTGRFPNPALQQMTGIVLAAVYGSLADVYPHPVEVSLIAVTDWKKATVGHGHAAKDQCREWAAREGVEAASQDEVDAYCIARAGAARLVREAA